MFFSFSRAIIILFLDLCTLYCSNYKFWNVFVITRLFKNLQCWRQRNFRWTLWKRKDLTDFLLLSRYSKSSLITFSSWKDSYYFYVSDLTQSICWNDALFTTFQPFSSCSFSFMLLQLSILKWMKKSWLLILLTFSQRDT